MITQQDKLLFRKIFGRPIEHFKSILCKVIPFEQAGIDVVKFDNWINPASGTSCAQAVREKYGEEAVKLIERVL